MQARTSFWIACVLGVAIAVACGGDDEGQVATGTPSSATPTSVSTAAATTPPSTGEGCPADAGPPAEGSGGPELTGRVTIVRLVFGCQPDVYIMNADGSGATQLTDDPSIDDESDLSPDRSKVVFFSGRSGETLLYIMNSDGSDLHEVGEGRGGDTSPRWSPDGTRIAFSRGGNIAVMNADGSEVRIIMQAQSSGSAEPCKSAAVIGGWAPDGKRIVYYTAILQAGATSEFRICAIDNDGENVQVLVPPGPENKLHAEPYWSPDGKKIAFRDDRDSDCSSGGACNYEIYTLDLETGIETNVTKHPSFDIEPAWSPDGEWIMFASNREDPNFDLYAVHPDGSGLRRVLNDPTAKDSYASWR